MFCIRFLLHELVKDPTNAMAKEESKLSQRQNCSEERTELTQSATKKTFAPNKKDLIGAIS